VQIRIKDIIIGTNNNIYFLAKISYYKANNSYTIQNRKIVKLKIIIYIKYLLLV